MGLFSTRSMAASVASKSRVGGGMNLGGEVWEITYF